MRNFARKFTTKMNKTAQHIIDIKNVSKRFGEKTALNNINLYVRKGEFMTILGPSGCGKTTLLRLLAGFETASEGIITIAGNDITNLPPYKRNVNTVFQKYALFPHLNVYDNIAFGLKLKNTPKEEILPKVKRALKMVNMSDYEYRDVNSLSGVSSSVSPSPVPLSTNLKFFSWMNRLQHSTSRCVKTCSWN